MANDPSPHQSLDTLPDEILQHILFYISSHETLATVQRLSKRLNRLCSEPLLWRYHCLFDFQYWDTKHQIQEKFRGNVGDVDWKALYIHRRTVIHRTTEVLDSVLEVQVGRIEKFQQIAEFGYDAKDTLLKHCQTDDIAEDVLARRYYSNAALDHIHRSEALAEWHRLAHTDDVPLERALGSFDLFVLHDHKGDLLEITKLFDDLAARLQREVTGVDQMSPRQKALAVAKFLRAHNLTGISSDVAYHDLQNNYIGIALLHPEHPSLPLISAAIYCAVAQRLGLHAQCAEFPNHVHVIVYPNDGESLDGESVSREPSSEPMYLDPFRTDSEVPVQYLTSLLTSWGVIPAEFSLYLTHSDPSKMVLRTSRNILTTVREYRGHGGLDTDGHPSILLHANPFSDMENAFYSALWANFMLGNSSRRSGYEAYSRNQFIPMILERFERLYPMDASLIERYICAPLTTSKNRDIVQLCETLRVIRQGDMMPKPIHSRKGDECRKVLYKVGQVFQHRRYGYTAVIIGWDKECGMNSDWRVQNQVQDLSRGANQSFYHALVEDTSIRYVAEDNVEITTPDVPTTLMSLAGQYFKRWDRENRVFVSNIRDEYPED
ncbi:hypothetical protein BP6252_09304 [Coleophoma cylindrospora]|uniref:F-box domain-containing protein n=1 Tax=Coleophoma cylindrospora TaxID=1849047 RepID=A0A3D8R1S8_9HELO|nr:hypothetical protein BP6252_09304 [Coleophoma cylindrospora]